ncbi:hypothetical protein ACFL59_07970 [Planctomycetota bacterium]
MPIAQGLIQFGSEAAFQEEFVKPLLTRMGFSLVVDYHGTVEYGKDLVAAEFDRFGHVRYHAFQVKYAASIGLSQAGDLAADGEQAFTNPFDHPQTGEPQYISSFYGANAGSISHQASTHFFASLRPRYGDNARLLDGKSLVQLDRLAVTTRLEPMRALLSGLRSELFLNGRNLKTICDCLRGQLEGGGTHPMQRLNLEAVANVVTQPHSVLADTIQGLRHYKEEAAMFNRLVDAVGVPLSTQEYVRQRIEAACKKEVVLKVLGDSLHAAVTEVLLQLGPLVSA